MRFVYAFLWVLIFPLAAFAQENIAIKDLLIEARSKIYNQPEQAGKIASYVISQRESNKIEAEATLLLAKSYYVRGIYNDAVKNAMKAKKLAEASKDIQLKVESTVFNLQLSRDLGLESVAKKNLDELTLLQEKISDENSVPYIKGKREQDRGIAHFQKDNLSKAEESFKNATILFSKANDSLSKNEVDLFLAEILLQKGELDSVSLQLEKLKNKIPNDYFRLQFLDIQGRLHFDKKEYEKSIAFFQEELDFSLKLPNYIYENKSLDGLTVSYLAEEDTKNFYSYKQQKNLVSTQIETDKNLAINSVYNFINTNQDEISDQKVQQTYWVIYFLAGFILILVVVGLFTNYLYVSKTKEYVTIYKYLIPRKTISVEKPKNEPLDKSSIVSEETERILLQKLDRFEQGKKFTNSDMSIALLATQFDTNTKYLSDVINRQKGKNFNSYINELRINYIIERLKTDPIYFTYKISYLAEESGFSSHSSFTTIFKSVTGISPTKFMDLLQQRQEKA